MKTVFAAVIMIRNSNPYILVMYAALSEYSNCFHITGSFARNGWGKLMNGKGFRRYKAGRYSLGLFLAGTVVFAQTPGETSPTPPPSVGAPVRTHVRMDSTHHPILGEEYYPKEYSWN
jgi:hypothetical protein